MSKKEVIVGGEFVAHGVLGSTAILSPSFISFPLTSTVEDVIKAIVDSVPQLRSLNLQTKLLRFGMGPRRRVIMVPSYLRFSDSSLEIRKSIKKRAPVEIVIFLPQNAYTTLQRNPPPQNRAPPSSCFSPPSYSVSSPTPSATLSPTPSATLSPPSSFNQGGRPLPAAPSRGPAQYTPLPPSTSPKNYPRPPSPHMPSYQRSLIPPPVSRPRANSSGARQPQQVPNFLPQQTSYGQQQQQSPSYGQQQSPSYGQQQPTSYGYQIPPGLQQQQPSTSYGYPPPTSYGQQQPSTSYGYPPPTSSGQQQQQQPTSSYEQHHQHQRPLSSYAPPVSRGPHKQQQRPASSCDPSPASSHSYQRPTSNEQPQRPTSIEQPQRPAATYKLPSSTYSRTEETKTVGKKHRKAPPPPRSRPASEDPRREEALNVPPKRARTPPSPGPTSNFLQELDSTLGKKSGSKIEAERVGYERTSGEKVRPTEKTVQPPVDQPSAAHTNPHNFKLTTFHKPTYCGVCEQLLWGIQNQGYRCDHCHFKAHKNCRREAGSCQSSLKFTVEYRPDLQTVDRKGEEEKKGSEIGISPWRMKMNHPLHSRTVPSFDLTTFSDPLISFNNHFFFRSFEEEIQSYLKHINDSKKTKNERIKIIFERVKRQRLGELQAMAYFRSRIAVLFSRFDPSVIPESPVSFIERPLQKGSDKKEVPVVFSFSKEKLKRTTARLKLVDPIRIGLEAGIKTLQKLAPVQSPKEVVLKLVGRTEYVFDLDCPAYYFDFIVERIEAAEKRMVLQFQVIPIAELQKEGITFDRNGSFKEKARRELSESLRDMWISDDVPPPHLNRQFGSEVAITEKVHDVRDIEEKFTLKIHNIVNLEIHKDQIPAEWDHKEISYFIEMTLSSGDRTIVRHQYTSPSKTGDWTEGENDGYLLSTDVSIRSLPPESLLCLSLYVAKDGKKGGKKMSEFFFGMQEDVSRYAVLGTVTTPLCDFTLRYKEGKQTQSLWPNMKADPTHSILSNPDPLAMVLVFELPTFSHPIVSLQRIDPKVKNRIIGEERQAAKPPSSILPSLIQILKHDLLKGMTEEEKKTVWKYRFYIRKHHPQHLPHVILSAPPDSSDDVRALVDPAYGLPPSPVSPITALELLDSKFNQYPVRSFAVECLVPCTESEISLWMLQLVQALKYEPTHFSSLSFFLLHKCLHSKKLGFSFFWMLAAELTSSPTEGQGEIPSALSSTERFLLFIDAFLNFCSEEIRQDLIGQITLMKDFCHVAQEVKEVKNSGGIEQLKKDRNEKARKCLKDIQLPDVFSLPTDHNRILSNIKVDKCKAMVSAAAPIWLSFTSPEEDAGLYIVIFKKGDDLRKDILVLQIFRMMDHIWKEGGYDFRLIPYSVVMTGADSGLVQVVTHSVTFADIQKKEAGALGALKSSGLLHWLASHNPTKEEMSQAVDNFVFSCAGYCVATYILGIGDRHNDNIMVTETGHFFHIDFGFILGDYLKFGIIDRETAPFILTPEFVRVMGSEFSRFEELCVIAYQLLRKKGNLIVSLFSMMLSSGIPGVSRFEDLYYLRSSLNFELTDEEAEKHFRKMIKQSVSSKRTRLNFAAHILAN